VPQAREFIVALPYVIPVEQSDDGPCINPEPLQQIKLTTGLWRKCRPLPRIKKKSVFSIVKMRTIKIFFLNRRI
ncbi:hypothetical protein, partial [Teichococcus rhizosphaerae]|uniref:hypothetical protein n=1 Tax=Teichococcus rhizosphaerae TaxID=1335062 RepID=UPI001C3F16FC